MWPQLPAELPKIVCSQMVRLPDKAYARHQPRRTGTQDALWCSAPEMASRGVYWPEALRLGDDAELEADGLECFNSEGEMLRGMSGGDLNSNAGLPFGDDGVAKRNHINPFVQQSIRHFCG